MAMTKTLRKTNEVCLHYDATSNVWSLSTLLLF